MQLLQTNVKMLKKNDTWRSKQWVSIKFKGRKMGKENKDHIPCY